MSVRQIWEGCDKQDNYIAKLSEYEKAGEQNIDPDDFEQSDPERGRLQELHDKSFAVGRARRFPITPKGAQKS